MTHKSCFEMDFKLLVFMAFFLLSACTNLNWMQNNEEIVNKRAMSRWNALIEGRLETAYQFQVPEYREMYSFKHYRRKMVSGIGLWQKAEVMGLECNDDKCIVTLTIYVKISPGRGFEPYESSAVLKESWARDLDSGEWFFYPESKNF